MVVAASDSTSPARGLPITSSSPAMSADSSLEPNEDEIEDRQLVLGDLLNHVLDKGVVISGDVIISIADIDLLSVDLKLVLSSVQTALEHHQARPDADVSLLRSRSRER